MSILPILYRSERGTGDWLAVPRRCPACRGNLAEDVLGDAVTCLLCARPVAELRDVRPAVVVRVGDVEPPRVGRPPGGGTTRYCETCDARLSSPARQCLGCYQAARRLPPRSAWPPCSVDGCERMRKTYSGGLCGRHTEEARAARRMAS